MSETAVRQRLEALLDTPLRGEGAPTLAHVEHTLTDGYAQALALEAERARLAREIGDLVFDQNGDAEAKTRALSSLAQRLAAADRDLAHLRSTLGDVRRRATALRSAAATA